MSPNRAPGFTNASLYETFLRYAHQSFCVRRNLANRNHNARVAMPPVFNYGDVNIDDVALFENFCF